MVDAATCRLGGAALIAGPSVAFVFIFLQPGVLLIDRVDSTDAAAFIGALSSRPVLSNATAIAIALGFLTNVFGTWVLSGVLRASGPGGPLSLAGFVLVLFGMMGGGLAQGLTIALAGVADDPGAVAAAMPVYAVKGGITLICGVAVALGYLVLAAAVACRDDFNRQVSVAALLGSAVCLAGYVLAILDPEDDRFWLDMARLTYIVFVVWPISLGLNLIRRAARSG
ncbi:MAG: hypothetical protein OXC14_10550 [Rhodospirillaceae bacterium]|nr:hypothetical protein [Rhodospirillaceae bacterium]